jgi:hypothetical protein
MMQRSVLCRLLCLVGLTGCFTVKHELPPGSYFGHLPKGTHEVSRPFAAEKMKNWLLAGLLPYSRFGVKDLVPNGAGVKRVEGIELETRFSVIDTIVWIVPGAFYGYYVWAPRTVRIEGSAVSER